MLIVSGNDEHVRLKSYDATVKGKTSTLKITLEVTDTFALSYLLRQLEDLMAAEPEKPAPKRRRKDESMPRDADRKRLEGQRLLALPPPDYTEDA